MAVISRLDRTLTANHAALVLFDTLHGYLHPKDEAKRRFLAEHNILANMQRLLAGGRKAGLVSFYPMGAHAADGSDWGERLTDTDMNLNPIGDKTIKLGIAKDTDDFEVAEELKPAKGDVLIPKHRWS